MAACWKELAMPARAEWELFDLAEDPGETADLAPRQADRVRELQALLQGLEFALESNGRVADAVDLSDEVKAQLRELGYLK